MKSAVQRAVSKTAKIIWAATAQGNAKYGRNLASQKGQSDRNQNRQTVVVLVVVATQQELVVPGHDFAKRLTFLIIYPNFC